MGFNEGGGRWWEIAPEPPKGDKLEKDGGIMGAVGNGGSSGSSGSGGNYGSGGRCEPHGQFVGIMGSASCKDGLIKNFAKGVAGEAIKTFGKV